MKIVKRNGKTEKVNFQKIYNRINKQTYDLNKSFVDAHTVAIKVMGGLYDGVTSRELDKLAAETAAGLTSTHPDYSILAARLEITSHYKEANVSKLFSETIEKLHKYIDPKTGQNAGLISDEVYEIVMANAETLNEAIVQDRDFLIDYFGFKTLQRSYLLKIDGQPIERIQHMWMRVAVGIWKDRIFDAIETYNQMSEKFFTHATPTLFNSGTKKPQMSSCFLIAMKDDSIDGIFKTATNVAAISQNAGGIGLNIHNIRATGAYIKGTNGTSNGLVPMLRVFNQIANYVDQGGGKRKGSFAIYLEPWHADFLDFLELKKNHGKEESRARDLFYASWTPDLFFKRVEEGGNWSFFSPDETPELYDTYGAEFEAHYERYEAEGKAKRIMKAEEVMMRIIDSQIETGGPFMLAKDAANQKSNQKNLGTIRSSNLCCEIIEYSSPEEEAVCNLASIALSMFVKDGKVDYESLYKVSYRVTKNLNQVIDVNYYPTEETKRSNMRHRPIGIGVQGMADMFAMLKLPFTSDEAKDINKKVFETIYFAAMTASNDGAIELYNERVHHAESQGLSADAVPTSYGAYSSFKGSPLSEGVFQFNMWEDRDVKFVGGKATTVDAKPIELSGMWDWDTLKESVMKYGVRNSLLLAPMPTASTSQILGNNEMFEPFNSTIYKRGTLAGEFVIVNKYLVNDLIELGLWSTEMKNEIISNDGSIQNIPSIPVEVKERYMTIWEIKQKDLIDMAADRGAFICQSQSFNLHINAVTTAKINSAIMYGWKKGLKTLNYYIRTKSAAGALKGLGGIETTKKVFTQEEKEACSISAMQSGEECEACGS
jgi:ribonucleoside-diphosphate reductase alpha chain